MTELSHPIFRFKFVKKKIVNGPQGIWSRYERHWKHQVAYSLNLNKDPIWEDIPDVYFEEDVDGNQTLITHEEYK